MRRLARLRNVRIHNDGRVKEIDPLAKKAFYEEGDEESSLPVIDMRLFPSLRSLVVTKAGSYNFHNLDDLRPQLEKLIVLNSEATLSQIFAQGLRNQVGAAAAASVDIDGSLVAQP